MYSLDYYLMTPAAYWVKYYSNALSDQQRILWLQDMKKRHMALLESHNADW